MRPSCLTAFHPFPTNHPQGPHTRRRPPSPSHPPPSIEQALRFFLFRKFHPTLEGIFPDFKPFCPLLLFSFVPHLTRSETSSPASNLATRHRSAPSRRPPLGHPFSFACHACSRPLSPFPLTSFSSALPCSSHTRPAYPLLCGFFAGLLLPLQPASLRT